MKLSDADKRRGKLLNDAITDLHILDACWPDLHLWSASQVRRTWDALGYQNVFLDTRTKAEIARAEIDRLRRDRDAAEGGDANAAPVPQDQSK